MDTSYELKKFSADVVYFCAKCGKLPDGSLVWWKGPGNLICPKCSSQVTVTSTIPVVKNSTKEDAKMNAQEFEKAFDFIYDKCHETLIERAKRYATDDDRLRNFYNVSKEQQLPAHRIPTLFSAKQREAFNEAIKGDIFAFNISMWEEWIIDQINYLILTYAILLNEGGRNPNGHS
jgi:DNA-directed RNA polymerase subunit RPC12/RpoP